MFSTKINYKMFKEERIIIWEIIFELMKLIFDLDQSK